MLRFLFISCLTCLVLIFQNCAKFQKNLNPNSTNQTLDKSSTQNNSLTLNLKPIDVKVIILNNMNNSLAQDQNTKLLRPDIFSYKLDLATGIIDSLDLNEQIIKGTYCLTASDKKELNNILTTSQICKPQEQNTDPADTMCTQSYIMPYAKFIFTNSEVALGEKINGCAIPIDLCGNMNTVFQGFVANILKNMKDRICK